MDKKLFLIHEFWILTTMGAFQRANVYIKGTSENLRNEFKKELKQHLDYLIDNQYRKKVNEDQHIINIKSISTFSKKYKNILKNGKLNFGVSQKLLNLYLKYLWCIDEVQEPPHFPVDRTIQLKLGIKESDVTNWTEFEDEESYCKIIELARLSENNLSNWELKIF